MKNKLENKVAIITGASSGIGFATAKVLKNEKVKVYNISRSKFENEIFAGSYECDVNDTLKMEKILKEIYDKEKRIDIFINNAGFGIAGAIENASKEKIYSLIETNLSAPITLSSLVIPYLKETKGNLINISSVGGIIPLPFQATYSATKSGIEIFSRALANEVKPFKIRVTSILPGDTKTAFTKNRIVENNSKNEKYQKIVEKSIKKVEKDEQTGKSPETVAKTILKVLKMKNPPLRKTVGLSYKCVVFLPRILSTKLVNFIVRKLYCK